jgi:hypothetical protein
MKPNSSRGAQLKRAEKIGVSLLPLLLMLAAVVGQAQQPLLQITAPANASLATEGTTITITVSADPSIQNVSVLVPYPLPEPQTTSSLNQFTLTLPTTIPPGLYNLTASGNNASGDVESAPVAIDVEPQYLGGISIVPTVLTLNSIGDQYPLRVIGTYSNGTKLDVTQSTQLSYSSYNTQIATVSSLNCLVCASTYLKAKCFGNPLAGSLTPTAWNSVFENLSNDAIVPLTSQTNLSTGRTHEGVIHTPSLEGIGSLDFDGPSELDYGPIASDVVDLLNEQKSGSDFQY